MVTYDARPSGFTQLTTTTEWELFMSAAGVWDGIDATNSFVPTLDTAGRNAVISAGSGLIKGQLWRCDASVSTPIPAASGQDRLDRLVLRLNRTATTSPTVVQPTVIPGAPSGSPALPPLQQTAAGLYDIPISYWTSHSTGTVDTLVDQRQYCGRNTVSMMSTYHPSPANARLGIELDTGDVFVWANSAWTAVGGNLIGYAAGPLGDIIDWTNQASITFSLSKSTTIVAHSHIIGTQITAGPCTVHVNRVQVDGTAYEVGRDRQVPLNDPSAISGSWIGVLGAGQHTIMNTAYSSVGTGQGAWRLSKAALMVYGF
jgi:hypothetical protein